MRRGLTVKAMVASRGPPISVVILGVPPVEEVDLIGTLEVFAGANRVLGARGPAYDVIVVSSQPKPIIAGECGVSLLAHGYYRRLREPVDTLVVVCGPTSKDTRDSRFSHWLQKTAGRAPRMPSVCVPPFILAEPRYLPKHPSPTPLTFAAPFPTTTQPLTHTPNPTRTT